MDKLKICIISVILETENKYLYAAEKQLLSISKRYNEDMEVLLLIDTHTWSVQCALGTTRRVGISTNKNIEEIITGVEKPAPRDDGWGYPVTDQDRENDIKMIRKLDELGIQALSLDGGGNPFEETEFDKAVLKDRALLVDGKELPKELEEFIKQHTGVGKIKKKNENNNKNNK